MGEGGEVVGQCTLTPTVPTNFVQDCLQAFMEPTMLVFSGYRTVCCMALNNLELLNFDCDGFPL